MPERSHSFGYWLRRRRKALDLTQEALGERVSCSNFTIRKIEADERRPSRPLAERLAVMLAIPDDERRAFIDAARALRAIDRLATDSPAPAVARPPPPASASGASEPTPFVGRGTEYELLTRLIAALASGAGHTVLIEGEPGIGKSRLLREVARHAEAAGLRPLGTNCYEIERAIPYQPVIDLVTRALERASLAALREIPSVSLAELAALVPAIAERFPDLPQLSRDFPEARQARLSRAVGQLLDALSEGRPCVLIVDDLQWADDASARVFHYLARQVAARPALVMYAYRDEDLDSDEQFARLVDALRHDTDARRVELARLSAADAETLLGGLADARFSTPGLAARLYRETEGNPFFLTSMLRSLSDGEIEFEGHASDAPVMLPDALRAAVRARITPVPAASRSTLETAAVLGRRFDFDTLLDVTGESEEVLLATLEVLVKRHLLSEEAEGGIYDFSHDKVREVAYLDIGGTRRRLLHRAVAEVLERRSESAAHEHDARLAEHYERAHVWSKALEHLVLAAEHSLALFALRDALRWFDRAVALSEAHPRSVDERRQLALYERRGAARAQAGQTEGAVADMRRVIAAARAAGDRDKTCDALIQLGLAYRRADAYEAATACLTEALAESRALQHERWTADTLYHLGTVAWSTGANGEALRLHQEAVEICERVKLVDLAAVQAYHGRGEAHFANAEPAAAIDCYTRSLEFARSIGDKSYESENLAMIGHACVGTKGLGDYPRALLAFDAALDIARTADLQWHLGPTLLGLDHVRACTGHYGQAWNGMRTTLRELENRREVRYQLIAYDFMSDLLLDVGLFERAAEHATRGITLARDHGLDFWRPTLEAQRAIAASRLGQRGGAPAVVAALERARRNSERHMTLRCLEGLAEISLREGSASACRAFAEQLLALAAENGLREVEAAARRWCGEACLAEGAYAEALAALSQAASLARAVGRVRLQMEVEGALARLAKAERDGAAAQRHDANEHAFGEAIAQSLVASELAR